MNGSWTYKLCNVNANEFKAVLGNTVQLQKYGYGFYLYEAVIQAIPHIGEKDIALSSREFFFKQMTCDGEQSLS